jgi:hypothetical protein
MANTITLTIALDDKLSRYDVLDRRDEIVDKLSELGVRVSAYVDGTAVYLADAGAATISDLLHAAAETASAERICGSAHDGDCPST